MKEIKLNPIAFILIIFGVVVITALICTQIIETSDIITGIQNNVVSEKKEILSERKLELVFSNDLVNVTEGIKLFPRELLVNENNAELTLEVELTKGAEKVWPITYKVYDSENNVLCTTQSGFSKDTISNTSWGTGLGEELQLEGYRKYNSNLKIELYANNGELINSLNIDTNLNKFETEIDDNFEQLSEIELRLFLEKISSFNVEEETETQELAAKIEIANYFGIDSEDYVDINVPGYNFPMNAVPLEKIDNILETVFGEKLGEFDDESQYKKIEENGMYYVIDTSEIMHGSTGYCREIEDITYADGIYNVTYTYCFPGGEPDGLSSAIEVERNYGCLDDLDIYRKTVELKIDNNEYSKFKVISCGESKIIN